MEIFRMKHYYPKSKDEALKLGDSSYRTGDICRNGHEAIRTIKGKCTQCVGENKHKQFAKQNPSRMVEIDHLLGIRSEEKLMIDPYYYLNEDF